MRISFLSSLSILSLLSILIIFIPDIILHQPFHSQHQQFASWKLKHHKNYLTNQQPYRFLIYINTKLQIQQHNDRYNQGLQSWFMKLNKFSDLTQQQFVKMYLSKSIKINQNTTSPQYYVCYAAQPPNRTAPDSFDWAAKCMYYYYSPAAVTAVKDHEACMSPSYAFATIQSIQSAKYISNGKLLTLSPQQVIDCATTQYGNNGCITGNVTGSFQYLHRNGVASDLKYPYIGFQKNCKYNTSLKDVQILGCLMLPANTQDTIKKAIYTQPYAASLNGVHLKNYGGGVYQANLIQKCKTDPNHWMVLVGYGFDPSKKKNYWKLKNSWGSQWGQQGYFYIIRKGDGEGQCGVQAQLYTPVV